MPDETVVRQANEGRAFAMLGGVYEVKVSSEESDGAMTVMEMLMPAGMGPPPHRHPGSPSSSASAAPICRATTTACCRR